MARLDIGEALGEGFRLIGRRPLDVMVWGLAYFIFGALPVFAFMGWMAGDYIDFVRHAAASAQQPDPQAMLAQQMKFQAIQPLIFVGSLVGRTLVYAAVFRAVLTPQDRGFFSLRFSKTELWLGLLLLVQGVCAALAMVGLMLPVIGFWVPTFLAGAHNSWAGWEVPLGLFATVAAGAVFVWLVIRFSMAAPMTFAARQFRLFESWSLTRGHALGLFGLYLLMVLIVGCVAVVVEAVVAGVGFVVLAGSGWTEAGAKAFFEQPAEAIVRAIAPYALGAALVASILGGFFMALFLAPWARAYAQLSGEPPAA